MREALMQVLSCSTLSVQLLRYQRRSVSTEKSDPVLHALQLAAANVEQTMGFLVFEPANKPQAQMVFAWLCKENSHDMLVAITNLFALQNKLSWRTLQFLHKQKLKREFARDLCSVVAKAFLSNDIHHSPTLTTLLARDFVHFLVWRCYDDNAEEENDEQLVEAFTIAIKREMVWCVHAQQPLLHAALQELINSEQQLPNKDILALVGKRGAAAGDDDRMWDSILPALSNATTSKEDVHANLYLACLLLARNKSKLQSILPFAIKALNSPGLLKQTHALAAALVRSVSLCSENSAAVQAALFPLLDDGKDGISSAAIEILVESTFHDPASILHELQGRLGKQSPMAKQREVALEVLTRVLESRPSAAGAHVAVEEKLVDLLLKQLSDPAQVKHRQLAAKCTARVLLASQGKWAELILPKLCLLLTSLPAKSAAAEAFVLTFSQATCLQTLLQVLMMQVGAPCQDEAFALTTKWLALQTDFPALEFVLDACCRNAQTMPQLFAFARRIGLHFYQRQNTAALTRWYLNLIPRLREKKDHVIDRLAPFLLLRVFPSLSLDLLPSAEDSSDLVKQLCLAAFSTKDEFAQVKKTAVELLAHLQASSLPWQLFLTILADDGTMEKLNSIVVGGFPNKDVSISPLRKTALFGCCQCLVSNILQEDFGEDSFPNQVTAQVVLQVLDLHGGAAGKDGGVAEGVCEYLVLAVVCEAFGQWEAQSLSATTTTTSTVAVVELEDEKKTEANTPTLDMVFKLLCEEEHSNQNFAAQVICQVLRCFLNEKSSLAAACLRQANVSTERTQHAGWACCKTIFSKLFAAGNIAHRSAFYLVVFTCCFTNMKLAAERSALSAYELTWLVNASLKDLSLVDDAAVRIQVLRLVGIVLTYPSTLLAQLPDGTFGRIQTTLRGIANLDTSAEARILAAEIARMFEK